MFVIKQLLTTATKLEHNDNLQYNNWNIKHLSSFLSSVAQKNIEREVSHCFSASIFQMCVGPSDRLLGFIRKYVNHCPKLCLEQNIKHTLNTVSILMLLVIESQLERL